MYPLGYRITDARLADANQSATEQHRHAEVKVIGRARE